MSIIIWLCPCCHHCHHCRSLEGFCHAVNRSQWPVILDTLMMVALVIPWNEPWNKGSIWQNTAAWRTTLTISSCRDLKNVSKIAHLLPVDANIIVLPIYIFGMQIVLYAPPGSSNHSIHGLPYCQSVTFIICNLWRHQNDWWFYAVSQCRHIFMTICLTGSSECSNLLSKFQLVSGCYLCPIACKVWHFWHPLVISTILLCIPTGLENFWYWELK